MGETPDASKEASFVKDGYCLFENILDGPMIEELIQTEFRVTEALLADCPPEERELYRYHGSNIGIRYQHPVFPRLFAWPKALEALRSLGFDQPKFWSGFLLSKPPHAPPLYWHQDYGYWYNNGCLFPDMASCYIAVDRAHKGNGCLQVIRGSHRMGRIEHGRFGGQTGADPERTALALEHLELVYCEMEPGSALFFHANLLHRSDPNRSEDPRWSLICCYNTRHNPCRDIGGHPSYRPLEKWDDARIKELGRRQWAEMQLQTA